MEAVKEFIQAESELGDLHVQIATITFGQEKPCLSSAQLHFNHREDIKGSVSEYMNRGETCRRGIGEERAGHARSG